MSERVGIEVFAPRIRHLHRSRLGVATNLTEALFPGYLFAHFAYPHQIRHVLSTHGVTGVVAFGGQPPAVADNVIDCLRNEVAHASSCPIAPVIETGAWVRILSGCFQYLEGRVLHFDPNTDRVRLLLTLLGGEVQVALSAERVALIDDARTVCSSGLMATAAEPRFRERCAV